MSDTYPVQPRGRSALRKIGEPGDAFDGMAKLCLCICKILMVGKCVSQFPSFNIFD